MLPTPAHYLFHVSRGDLALLAVASDELPPCLAVEFLVRTAETLADYLESLTPGSLRAHFVTVYQLLEEMCDSGVPTHTEANVLKELVPPPSLGGRLAAAAGVAPHASGPPGAPPVSRSGAGGLNGSSSSSASSVPWRRSHVRHAPNEVFFDLVEQIDAVLDGDGRLLSGGVVGELFCNSRLSGLPDLTLSLARASLLDDVRFHPCVRLARFAADRVLSFVPPDGSCRLMSYRVRDPPVAPARAAALRPPPLPLPLYVKPSFSFSAASGRVSVVVGPRVDLGKPLEAIVVRVPLPSCVASIDVSANHGAVGYDEKAKVIMWDVGRLPKDTTPILSGVLQLDRGVEGRRDGDAAADDAAGGSGGGSGGVDEARATMWDEALVIEASFKVCGACVSGLGVDALHLLNETYRLYKGVRYTTTSGRFCVRV